MTTRSAYHGRLAPTSSGYLHRGHARTFFHTWRRARDKGGRLSLRIEDIDRQRCRTDYARAILEDLEWLGIDWDGEPVYQSRRFERHLSAWHRLVADGHLYPSPASRKEVAARSTVYEADGETRLFPTILRRDPEPTATEPGPVNWRFRVPDGKIVRFADGRIGAVQYQAGRDFGDFPVWRRDGGPSYELAVVVDDADMGITEVVRGEDLLLSTARQLLLYDALGHPPPAFLHLPLVRDPEGNRLSKTAGSAALRVLREQGMRPDKLIHADFDLS